MNFPPLPLLFFIDARLKGKAEEKNQREKKAITSVKNLRQEEIIFMFEFTSLQFSVIFTLFFLLLGGKVDDDGVAQSESNKCLQIFSLSPFSNQSDFLVFTLFSRYNAFLWAFTHAHVQKILESSCQV